MCIGKRFVGIVGLVVLMGVSMGVECKAEAKQDLTIKITNCPKIVKPGQEFGAFQIIATNHGDAPVKDVAIDIVLRSDTQYPIPAPYAVYSPNYSNGVLLKGGRTGVSLNPGQTHNVELRGAKFTIPVDTPPGNYYLCAVIDAGNKVEEVDEKNNYFCCPIKVAPEGAEPGRKCCIAGTYDGTNVDDPKCPDAEEKEGKFILVINQEPGCGSKIWGEGIDPEDNMVTHKLEGTITPGPRGCCTLKGIIREGSGKKCEHRIKAILCRGRDGKWYTNNGVYHALTPGCCNGTFKMKQR